MQHMYVCVYVCKHIYYLYYIYIHSYTVYRIHDMHKIKSALQKKWATATELLLKWKISVGLLAFGWSVLVGTELPACCQTILAIQPYNWIARALRCIQVLGLLCQIGCASAWLQHVCHLRFEQKHPGGQQESQPGRVWQSSVFSHCQRRQDRILGEQASVFPRVVAVI